MKLEIKSIIQFNITIKLNRWLIINTFKKLKVTFVTKFQNHKSNYNETKT